MLLVYRVASFQAMPYHGFPSTARHGQNHTIPCPKLCVTPWHNSYVSCHLKMLVMAPKRYFSRGAPASQTPAVPWGSQPPDSLVGDLQLPVLPCSILKRLRLESRY